MMYRILHIPTLKYVVDYKKWLDALDIHKTLNLKKITITKTSGCNRYGVIKFHNKETLEAYFKLFSEYEIYEDGSGLVFLDCADKDTKPINRVEFVIEKC